MKIGIMGSGVVGESLGRALIAIGHDVMFSSREPASAKMQALAQATGGRVGSHAETLAYGELIAIALRWEAIPDVVAAAGDWRGKIVLDLANRFGPAQPGMPSPSQELAQITGARVVKTLNTIGAEHYQNADFDGEAALMLLAGDDAAAKSLVAGLLRDLGFEPLDIGGLDQAHHLDALAALWVHLALRAGQGRDVAFRLSRRRAR